ncbi:MAG TPA: DUF4433 domain-containing protein [Cyclobacteriaceae bacterium]|nr:DUF4433 domain-containing protein [Cyclobacteriaceae bacterium]
MGLADWRKSKLNEHGITDFFYFSMIDNLESFLRYGILPKNEIVRQGWNSASFAEKSVQDRRHVREIQLSNCTKVTIHDIVPVYLIPRTPTLSARRPSQNKIFFIVIDAYVLAQENIEFAFSDGNAASRETSIFNSLYKLKSIPWDVLKATYWNDFPDGRRKRNAEFLIFPRIAPEYFRRIVVSNPDLHKECNRLTQQLGLSINIEINTNYFFI